MSLVSFSLFLDYEFLGKWIKKLGEGLDGLGTGILKRK